MSLKRGKVIGVAMGNGWHSDTTMSAVSCASNTLKVKASCDNSGMGRSMPLHHSLMLRPWYGDE